MGGDHNVGHTNESQIGTSFLKIAPDLSNNTDKNVFEERI
jgi:hypothetical protein